LRRASISDPRFGHKGAPIAGRTHTPESKAQMSYANTGKIHTPESKAQMSDSKSGANNPMFGKTHSDDTRAKISKAMSGANHPMYGKSGELSPLSIQVNVYSLDNVLVRSFSSQVAAPFYAVAIRNG
jgi:group I intron endonuclease